MTQGEYAEQFSGYLISIYTARVTSSFGHVAASSWCDQFCDTPPRQQRVQEHPCTYPVTTRKRASTCGIIGLAVLVLVLTAHLHTDNFLEYELIHHNTTCYSPG